MFDDVDEKLFTKIADYFPEYPGIKDHVANLNSLTPSIIKEIKVLLNDKKPVEERIAAKDRALKIKAPFGTSMTKDQREFMNALLQKLNFTHITPATIPKMFSHISSRLPKDSEELPDEVITLLKFMEAIAEVIPESFSGCYLQLKAMMTDENEILVDNALSILSHTAHVLTKQSFSKYV